VAADEGRRLTRVRDEAERGQSQKPQVRDRHPGHPLKQVHTSTHPGARLDSEIAQDGKLQNSSAQPVDVETLQNLSETLSGEAE